MTVRRWIAVAALVACPAFAAPVADPPHIGIADCASSQCHGKTEPDKTKTVWLNESTIWTNKDWHSRAYRILREDQSLAIARKMGLPNAVNAKVCLDCHADNVPKERLTPNSRFQISEGVSCEACHGGAATWVRSHKEPGATHADNLAKGMYPTEDPAARAALCLNCHLGTADKFATHEIMAAGHPRLTFQLETFTRYQPAHFEVDADYVKRKGKIDTFNLWLAGQLEASDRYLRLLKTKVFTGSELFPEIAFYDCDSCHHSMKDIRWNAKRAAQGVKPGAMRLQDHSLLMVAATTKVLEPAEYPTLTGAIAALVKAGHRSGADVQRSADVLLQWLAARKGPWLKASYDPAKVRAVRRALVELSADGTLSDFAVAAQVVLGVESLSLAVGDSAKLDAAFNRFYKAVEDDRTFRPGQFSAAARDMLKSL